MKNNKIDIKSNPLNKYPKHDVVINNLKKEVVIVAPQKEVMRICANGDIYVNDELTTNNQDVAEAFINWVNSVRFKSSEK
jgi:hypothetical protein